jgi:muramoyltetrapeptide carboxypeptidase
VPGRPKPPADKRPPALQPGDVVAVVAPAGPVPRDAFFRGLRILEGRYLVQHDEALFSREGYFAGSDARRAAELNRYLRDPQVKAIVCARGGYGLLRILPLLDADALRARPRPIVGFSDVTALLAWAHGAAGVRTIHGPVVTQLGELPAADAAALVRLLEEPAPTGPWFREMTAVVPGRARGPLLGGNLEVLSRLVGTRYLPRLQGAILVLEEVGERPYRIDRTLTQLLLAGVLDGVAGVVVGRLEKCEEPDGSGPSAAEVVRERLAPLGVPFCVGAPVGHAERNKPFPFGAPALLDATAGTLELAEGAVA